MNQDKRQRFAAGTGAAPEGSTGNDAGRGPREGAGPEQDRSCATAPLGAGPGLVPLPPGLHGPLTPRVSPAGWTCPKDELPGSMDGTGRTQSLGSLGSPRGDPLPLEGHIPTGQTLLSAGSWVFPGAVPALHRSESNIPHSQH